MVQPVNLEALRAEHAALGKENAALRSRVVSAQLAGDESELKAEQTPTSTARLATLSREQKVLVAGLRLGEELVALRKSNEVLFRRGQQLQEENASFRLDATMLPAQAQAQQQSAFTATAPPDFGSPTVLKKCSAEEKAERRDLVASLLKAGLNQDIHTVSGMRTAALETPVVPRMQLSPTQEGYARSRATEVVGSRSRESGARNRESSHSGAVEESKHLRKLAVRDMMFEISANTPRSARK
jgi:hypothetical protein